MDEEYKDNELAKQIYVALVIRSAGHSHLLDENDYAHMACMAFQQASSFKLAERQFREGTDVPPE